MNGWKKAMSIMLCAAMIASGGVAAFAEETVTANNPEQPKVEGEQTPESEKPEGENQENPKPDTELPESENPESEKPETELPESENPESEKPETELPAPSEALTAAQNALAGLPVFDNLTEETDAEALQAQVKAAREAYDALSDEEKALIEEAKLNNLLDLEFFFANRPVLGPSDSDKVVQTLEAPAADATTLTGQGTEAEPYQVKNAEEFNQAVSGEGTVHINFTEGFSGNSTQLTVPAGKNVVLNLNGQTVTLNQPLQVLGTLTLKDTDNGQLKTEMESAYLIEVGNTDTQGTLVIENGTYTANYRVIKNKGSVTINNGTLRGGEAAIANYGKEKETVTNHKIDCTINNGTVEAKDYGIVLFGKGTESLDHTAVVLNIHDGTITVTNEGQGIATNASSGKFAGYTVNMTGGSINAGNGTGMYLPAIGQVNISGGTVHGDNQGIRIAAGELNITGGTITNNEARNGEDLVDGGSGGTAGAIVAGKAGKAGSSGYVGNLTINISGNTTIENKATENNDAIVVSDKNMASGAYQNNKIAVNVSGSGVTVKGNVYQATTTLETDKEQAGGSVNISVENAAITGNVEKTGKGSVSVTGSNVSGTVTGGVEVSNSTVGGQQVTESKPFQVDGDKKYATLAEAIQNISNGGTIKLLADINNATGVAVWERDKKNFTIDFDGHTYTLAGPGEGSQGYKSQGFHFEQGNTITLKNGTIKVAPGAKNIYMIIQNYADLTLENMQIYSENMLGDGNYPLSFNNGNIVFTGNTSVYTPNDNLIAFDVCKFSTYPSVNVTFTQNYTGTINGRIFYDSGDSTSHKLVIQGNGTFGKIDASTGNEEAAKQGIQISGGNFAESVEEYVVATLNYELVSNNGRYSYYQNLNEAKNAAEAVGGTIKDRNGDVVAVVTPTNPTTPTTPSNPSRPSRPSDDDEGSSSNSVSKEEQSYNDFWNDVISKINRAEEGDVITVRAGSFTKMPNKVMKALEKNGVGLVIKHNGGEDIVIPAGHAAAKANKLFWTFKDLGNYVLTEEELETEQEAETEAETEQETETEAETETQTELQPQDEAKPNPETGAEDYLEIAAAAAALAGVGFVMLKKKN